MNINDIYVIFASLLGFPAFIAAGVNVAKYFQLLNDGSAPKVVLWANIVLFVGVAVAFFTGNIDLLTRLDAEVGNVALFMLSFIAFVSSLGVAKIYHAGLRGTPVIGESASLRNESLEDW